MEIFKNKKIVILSVIMVVFTLSYFIIANKISYAFKTDDGLNSSYDITVSIIEKAALVYAKNNPKLFAEEKRVYIKVQDLIDNKLLSVDSDGNIINPLTKEKINEKVIELKSEDDKVVAAIEK